MTDKQIIIDGVDVLNCGYFSQFEGKTENACYIQPRRVIGSDVNIGFGSCDCSPNCYYKQLKRKEQECEELKEKYKKYYQITLDDEIQINDLHKALQEIKEIAYLLNDRTMVRKDICDRLDVILQKISEVEV